MPRRFNYTGRKKINRSDASIVLRRGAQGLTFDATLHLAEYKLDRLNPPPRVYVEAYRGASTIWKRFDFGRVGTLQPPPDRSLSEFGVPEGILFRVKISADGDALGKLLAEADKIQPRLPDEQETKPLPLIQHVPANDIGDELWRVTDMEGDLPLLKINDQVSMGVNQFLLDPIHRALVMPAVMRQLLTWILVVEKDTGDEEDPLDWRRRWIAFAERLGVGTCPGVAEDPAAREQAEDWIDDAVAAFAKRAHLFGGFDQPDVEGGNS